MLISQLSFDPVLGDEFRIPLRGNNFLQIRYGAYFYDELSLMAKLFTHDLSDHLRSERLLRDAKIGTKSFVDQSLISLPCLLGLSLESAKDLIV